MRAAGIALLLSGCVAQTASALETPEILYREGVSESEPAGPWLPLDGARISGLGFILGTRMQAKPAGDSAILYRLTALTVPDGHADQGSAFDPAAPCHSTAQTAGQEIVLAIGRFEGPGSYTIRVDEDVASNGATQQSCSGGVTATATFTIDPDIVATLRAPGPFMLGSKPFRELAALDSLPLGGAGEMRCARDAQLQPDGSLTGKNLTKALGPSVLLRDITHTGRWTCAGRARSTAFPIDGEHYTRWSPPVSFVVRDAFTATLTLPDDRRPRYTLAYSQMPPGSEGGRLSLRISAAAHCPHVPVRTLHARVDSHRRARFTFRLPERNKADLEHGRSGIDAYGWNFRVAFAGTELITPAHHTGGAFVYPSRHQYGDTLGFPGLRAAYCTRTT